MGGSRLTMQTESVVIYYNDGIYIFKHDSTNFHSLTLLPGPVDLHFGLGLSQNWLKIKDFPQNGRLKVKYADLN